ncbi:MAG TPA: hypothetical protein VGN80_12370 [Devosiaceae bacterium]|nr:hypothetical protein [Devosiaceae bacterium]
MRLLDGTGFYTRAQWGQFLGVSEPALSQWVNDRTVPRADLLRMVIDVLRTRGGAAAMEALASLEEIMDEPSEKISPIGSRFAPDLRSYLRVRSFSDIGRAIKDEVDALEGSFARRIKADRTSADWDAPVVGIDRLGPAWRAPRLVRENGPHGRERRVSADEFASGRHLVLMGSAGSGKSALLSHLMAHHQLWRQADSITARKSSADSLADWFTNRHARADSTPLVVDGLDEMAAGERGRAVKLIGAFALRSPETSIIVASRPVDELDRLSGFEKFSIAPLTDVEVVAEVTHSPWALRNPGEADRFLCHLVERQALKPALRHPFFLNVAWSLFEHNAITPFADGIVIESYVRRLMERDHARGFSRAREPWANPQNIASLLGEISIHLLSSEKVTFDDSDVSKWLEKSSRDAPIRRLLDLLLVLGLLIAEGRRYSFAHRVFVEYFAARFINENATNAVNYLRYPAKHMSMGGAIRLAGGLASDATPLLKTAMSDGRSDYAFLAQMIAQPIAAEPTVLLDSCKKLVSWLDERTSDWRVTEDLDPTEDTSSRWFVRARVNRGDEEDAVARTLRAIHQARSGPAYRPLKDLLSEVRSPFLPIFAEAMDVEGRLNVEFGNGATRKGSARVAVESLQLA